MTTRGTGAAAGIRSALIIMTLVGGVAISIATVLSFFGSSWWFLDMLANYRWYYAWLLLGCAIVYALIARGVASVIFVAALVVNAFVLSPMWFGSQPDGTGEDGVEVVALDMSGSTTDEERVLDWLFDTDADVIIASGVAGERLLPLTVDGSPYQMIAVPDDVSTGVAIIAKQPWAVQTWRTAETNEPIHVVSVATGDRTFDVVTPWSELATNGGEFAALDDRVATLEEIVRTRTNPVMIIGPVGATRFTSRIRDLLSSGIRDATEGSGYLSTAPVSSLPLIGGWIGLPVDLVLMTAEITPFSLVTGPDVGVGHLPVTVVVGPVATG